MQSFLSRSQVADYLEITAEDLTVRMQAGNFPQPDVLVGTHHEGWARDSVDRWRSVINQQISCRPSEVADIITAIRRAAEDVRGHSRMPDSAGISITVPRDLYSLAALIESELRRLVTTDHWLARLRAEEIAEADVASIDFALPPVPSVVVHPNLNLALGAPNLRRAADRLDAAATALRTALISGPSRELPDQLCAQAYVVRAYADTLDNPARSPEESPT